MNWNWDLKFNPTTKYDHPQGELFLFACYREYFMFERFISKLFCLLKLSWRSNYITTWLLRLSYADLLTASIKLPISPLKQKAQTPPPPPLPAFFLPAIWPAIKQKLGQTAQKKKRSRTKRARDFHMNSFDCISLTARWKGGRKKKRSHLSNNRLNHPCCSEANAVANHHPQRWRVEGVKDNMRFFRTWKCALHHIYAVRFGYSTDNDTFECHNSHDLFRSLSLSYHN